MGACPAQPLGFGVGLAAAAANTAVVCLRRRRYDGGPYRQHGDTNAAIASAAAFLLSTI